MALVLSIVRCPDNVPPERRTVMGGELSIGRGPNNNWILPDPERVVSKNHCVIAFRQGGWHLTDISQNGTYVNGAADPLGFSSAWELRDGDRLRMGSYELEVRLEADPGDDRAIQKFSQTPSRNPSSAIPDPFGDDPFGDDPFAPISFDTHPSDHGLQPATRSGLPLDFDPMAPEPLPDPFQGPAQSDHTPAFSDVFRPPPVNRLPDDWDLDPEPITQPQRTADAAAPPAHAPGPTLNAFPTTGRSSAPDELLEAFLRGAGIKDSKIEDPVATMEQLGAVFRAAVVGVRRTLMARSAVKREFRIEQTQIQIQNNNPLKFSLNEDDAVSAMIGSRRGDKAAAKSMTEALQDIHRHELATMAAMQVAVRALLTKFDPKPLREKGQKDGGLLPAQRTAHAFEHFEKIYDQISKAMTDDFDGIFGKEFARAYEAVQREAFDQEHP